MGAIRHGHAFAGKKTRLYFTWRNMIDRCKGTTEHRRKYYTSRGITVCAEWQRFVPFKDWAEANGYADHLVIDRINNDGNYEPSNCRWASHLQSTKNRRHTQAMADHANRVRKTVPVICVETGQRFNTFQAAATWCGAHLSNIRAAALSGNRSAGLHWQLANT